MYLYKRGVKKEELEGVYYKGRSSHPRRPQHVVVSGASAVCVEDALDWAYRRQRVEGALESLDERWAAAPGRSWSRDGVVAVQRIAALGCRVDASMDLGYDVHEDARAIAAIAGRYRLVVELARAGALEGPWWAPNGPGRYRPETDATGRALMIWPTTGSKKTAIACRVVLDGDDPRVVEHARAVYRAWWSALAEVAAALAETCLETMRVRATPRARAEPWRPLTRGAGA